MDNFFRHDSDWTKLAIVSRPTLSSSQGGVTERRRKHVHEDCGGGERAPAYKYHLNGIAKAAELGDETFLIE